MDEQPLDPLRGKSDLVNHSFSNPWPLQSPNLTPNDFWLCGHLKNVIYREGVAMLAQLKESITLHMRTSHQTSPDELLNTST
ncbi:hypothetical protein AVEN_46888-1 [Araneus ventricosus]|uniref:Uncharacterized protein n=1 Tax=Araneus ventricosus TaxID=182803 RepID=A0A4Y2CME7_ARAVE|nr:hypothetical protein AVEN_46888-1 [Araneus ventricosus]